MNARIAPSLSAKAVPAWAIFAWPTVLWQAPPALRPHFLHLGTRVTFGGDALHCGQTIWGDPDGEQAAGLAWDWVELARGVVAMADPMSVVTNVRLLRPGGEVMSPMEAAPHLNDLVHALPWQSEVQRALAEIQH